MRLKRICFVVNHPEYAIGGSEIQSHFISTNLHQRGYDICYLNPIANSVSYKEEEIIDGIKIYNYKICKWFRIREYFGLRKILKRINADMYYIRGSQFLEGFIVYYAKKINTETIWQSAAGRNFLRFSKIRELINCKNVKAIFIYFFDNLCNDLLRIYAIKNATYVISQTEEMKAYLKRKFKRNSFFIRKGIPEINKEIRKENNKMNVLYLRNIRKPSRIELFIDIAKKIDPNNNMEFNVIGRISKDYKSIISIFKQNNINYLGPMDHDSVLKALEKTHILIDTVFEYNTLTTYSNSLLEALQHQVCVITFCTNPDSIFYRNNMGFVVKSVDEVVEKLLLLKDNPKLLKKIGLNAYQYIDKNHKLDDEVSKLVEIIHLRLC